jgi:hypothetical protein
MPKKVDFLTNIQKIKHLRFENQSIGGAAENNMVSVMKRLNEDFRFKKSKPYFLFKTLQEVKETIFERWRLYDGASPNLF